MIVTVNASGGERAARRSLLASCGGPPLEWQPVGLLWQHSIGKAYDNGLPTGNRSGQLYSKLTGF